MWLDIAEAPADVPATTAPCWNRSRIASASRVPPIVDDSRSWLPPVRKTPVASWTASVARLVVGLRPGDRVERAGPCLTPSSPKTARYRSPASSPSDDAVLITAIVASAPPASADEAVQDDAVADLVLRAADDDDGSIGHRPRRSLWRLRQRIADGRRSLPTRAGVRAPRADAAERPCARARMRPRWPTSADPRTCVPSRAARAVSGGSWSTCPTWSIAARAAGPASSGGRSAARCRALRDPRRIAAIILLSLTFALLLSGMIARGEAGGADARAYWAGVRIWLNGGDPYHPTGPFLPYVYAPWMLPLFTPWAALPWDVAWFVWRVGTILLLLWTIDWAYRRRPLTTAVIVALLGFPFGANLDTGNINLQLTLMLWAAQFTGPRARRPALGAGDLDEVDPGRPLAGPRAADASCGA